MSLVSELLGGSWALTTDSVASRLALAAATLGLWSVAFCGSSAGISFALTGLDGDPDDAVPATTIRRSGGSWARMR